MLKTYDLTDLDIALYTEALYTYPDGPTAKWDHVDTGQDDDQNYWAAIKLRDYWLVVNRGSTTTADWVHDFEAVPIKTKIGEVDAGFFAGMERQWSDLQGIIRDSPWVCAGHSLGAARCCLLAGLGEAHGNPPLAYVRMGEPRPGYADLKELLMTVPGRSYRNTWDDEIDLVTTVPYDVPVLFPYEHPQPLIDVHAQPAPNDPWNIFSLHHIQLYIEGIKKLVQLPTV